MPEKEYIAAIGKGNIITSAGIPSYLLGLEDRGLVSEVSGPNSSACETPIYSASLEEDDTFVSHFGEDAHLHSLCYAFLNNSRAKFIKSGGDLNEPRHHPRIPPAHVFFGGVIVYRARIVNEENISPALRLMEKRFKRFDIDTYRANFKDSDRYFKFIH